MSNMQTNTHAGRWRPAGWLAVWLCLITGLARADYVWNFDTLANGKFELGQNEAPPPPGIENDPGSTNMFLRLVHPVGTNISSLTFDINDGTAAFGNDLGAFNEIVAEFDFRVGGPAEGFGFILLDTGVFGRQEVVPRQGFQGVQVYQEPTATNSLGIGFDIHQGTEGRTELNDNHVSVHFNGELLKEFDVGPTINLNGSNWIHARVTVRPRTGQGDVSVELTEAGGAPVVVVTNYLVGGMIPYESRPHFGGRSGPVETCTVDLDNLNIQYRDPVPAAFAFGTTNFATMEPEPAYVYVRRTGGGAENITVDFATVNGTAVGGADFVATNGTLTFVSGESIKLIPVTILSNAVVQGGRTFTVTLSNPSGGATLPAPASADVTIHDDDDPALVGSWNPAVVNFPANQVNGGSPVVSIHLNLLPDGRIVMWDRHGSAFGGTDGIPRIWDPVAGTFAATPDPMFDLFCAGHALMVDGRLFVPGGHVLDGVGEDKATIYDPAAGTWTRVADMNAGRWYPTVTMLASGDLLVEAGTIDIPTDVNPVSQVWQVASGTWRDHTNAATQHGKFPVWANYYPFMYQAPNGKVFCAGPQQMSRYLDPAGAGLWTDVAASSLSYRDYGTSVLYDDGKVMITGGNPPEVYNTISLLATTATILPSRVTEVIDLNPANPVWRVTNPMNIGRRHATATLLPDGTVLVTGGSSAPGFNVAAGAARWAELWNPANETWTPMASARRYNGYHANALLLPDGRVVTTGGGHPNPPDVDAGAPNFGSEPTAEFYSPPYLFKGARPAITSAPGGVTFGETFYVATPDAAAIGAVNWIKVGNTTHAFNQNQRINRLAFTNDAGGLHITAPANPYLCPPGHYYLFILNTNGVPSVAATVKIAMGILKVEPGGIDKHVTVTTVPGHNYLVEFSDRVPATSWTAVSSAVTATGFTTVFTNTAATFATNRFYRVRQVP